MLDAAEAPLTVMVASTVYSGFRSPLEQIAAALTTYGYKVWNSELGTLPNWSNLSNRDNCLRAVADCDLFVGIIRPFYGSSGGVAATGGRSITHDELREAVRLNKPRWLLVDGRVTFARQLLKPMRFTKAGAKRRRDPFLPSKVLDDARVFEMYEDAVRSGVPYEERTGNWVHEYFRPFEILQYLGEQMGDVERVRNLLAEPRPDGVTA